MTLTYKNPKAKSCVVCERVFVPWSSTQLVCRQSCAMKKARADRLAAEKAEKESVKRRKEAIKKVSELEADCRKIVQEIARIRDHHEGCISCHMGPNYDGQWHGSHYRSHGGCSSLQFHLWNIHKACAQCNTHKAGNIAEYRPRLAQKIGADRVEWLDNQPKSQKFSREYLYRFKAVMGKRLRRMRKLK